MVKFSIIETCDLEHYAVQIAIGDDDNSAEWVDISKPFNTYDDAIDWAEKLNDHFQVIDNTYNRGE